MIHKIKAMHDNGDGSSIREIARELKLSRNTVRKYLAMNETAIVVSQSTNTRHKTLDAYRNYIKHLLGTFPRLSAVKIKRKLEAKVGPLDVASRSLRRYVSTVRDEVPQAQRRYYEPVLDNIPGVQCQVDPGELRDVIIGGIATTVYFVVFVLSFSRLMYAGVSRRPINTERFIQLHDAAFRAFGGRPEECVYDQTRMVVINEQYRELDLNQRFAQYATAVGYRIRACEGYDPESKGKVEAGVKYVKQDALYGETFSDWSELEHHLQQWLDQVANVRIHGTTGQQPQAHYDQQEREKMLPYLTPDCLTPSEVPGEQRKVDKTGLISFKSNKYSVPMVWQTGRVNVLATEDGQLLIYDRQQGEVIASHILSGGKGEIIKNRDHYRDKGLQISDLEEEIIASLGSELGSRLCQQLKRSDPSYYKDKLRGVKQHLKRLVALPTKQLAYIADKEGLMIGTLLDYLSAWEANPQRMEDVGNPEAITSPVTANLEQLSCYEALTQQGTDREQGGIQ